MGGLKSNNDRYFDHEEVSKLGELLDTDCLGEHPFLCQLPSE